MIRNQSGNCGITLGGMSTDRDVSMFSKWHCYCRKGQFIGADLPLVLLYWQLNMEERSAEWIQNIEGY